MDVVSEQFAHYPNMPITGRLSFPKLGWLDVWKQFKELTPVE